PNHEIQNSKEIKFESDLINPLENVFFWDILPVSYDAECLLSKSFDNVSAKMFPEEDELFLKSEEGKEFKTILLWNYFHTKNYAFGSGRKPFESACCKEKDVLLPKIEIFFQLKILMLFCFIT
ncbi:hypothetical protein Avbf_07204, partial [Armadillidium vulgare]